MFEHSFSSTRQLTNSRFNAENFAQFVLQIGKSKSEFPYEYENPVPYKGKHGKFRAVSWGGYLNADNVWTIFIAYRCNNPTHTIQHSWRWDEQQQLAVDGRVYEFVN